jgi:hypothetical protein
MATASALRLVDHDGPVTVYRVGRSWRYRVGDRTRPAASKDAAQRLAESAAGVRRGTWTHCSEADATAGLSESPRPVHAVSRPVDLGPVEREPQTLREYLRILYGDVPARDLRYLEWIRTLPCCVCGMPGQSEAHHEPPKGIGGGHSTDYDAVPLCLGDHRIRHGQASGDAEAVRAECERTRLLLLATYYAAEDAPVRLARA